MDRPVPEAARAALRLRDRLVTGLTTTWTPAALASEWHAIEQRLQARKILRGLHRDAGLKAHATRRAKGGRDKP